MNRRQFFTLSGYCGAGLVLGLPLGSSAAADPVRSIELRPLIRVAETGQVTLFAQNPEMGQGVKTALPMILAEELDVDWSAIRIQQSDWDPRLTNQFSGGSLSIRLNFENLRRAGASARVMLLQAAAERWGVPVSTLMTRTGQVVDSTGSRLLGYGALAAAAADLPVPEDVPLKSPQGFGLIGRSTHDVDLAPMIRGALTYGMDLSLPDMVYAVVRRSPCGDGQVARFDPGPALAVEGVIACEVLDNREAGGRIVLPNSPNFVSGVAVVATSTWPAMVGARRLDIDWQNPTSLDDSDGLFGRFQAALERPGETIRNDGDVDAEPEPGAVSVEATFRLPFLAHVPMEPMNCTAAPRGDGLVVWAPTQNPGLLAQTVAKALGVAESSIQVHVLRSGGAFGRRFYSDFAVDAALLARRLKRPVKLIWTREDDIRHDYFRPASLQRVRASLGLDGRVRTWHHRVTSHSRMPYLERDGSPSELDNYEFPAGFVPHLRYEYVLTPARVPVGQWRAVEHSSNVFVVASVLDELARASGRDPVRFLLDLIGEEPVQVRDDFLFDAARLSRVVRDAAALSGWKDRLPEGRGRGIAASYNQGAWVAEVAEVSVEGQRLVVHRITVVIDCGRVINPQAAENQVQGAVMEGLAAALLGEITVTDGVVDQSNFHDYPWPRLRQAPAIDVHFVASEDVPRGLGEPPLPPVAPAVCNAIREATGLRIRELPLKRAFRI